jgi:hypothetical protein
MGTVGLNINFHSRSVWAIPTLCGCRLGHPIRLERKAVWQIFLAVLCFGFDFSSRSEPGKRGRITAAQEEIFPIEVGKAGGCRPIYEGHRRAAGVSVGYSEG